MNQEWYCGSTVIAQTAIVFLAYQAKHSAAVVVCYKALPKISTSRQSNESLGGSSCTVPGSHDLALKKTRRGRRYGNSAEPRTLERVRDFLDSAQKHNCGTIVERYLENEQCQMHDCTQTDMEELDRGALERKNCVTTLGEKALLQ